MRNPLARDVSTSWTLSDPVAMAVLRARASAAAMLAGFAGSALPAVTGPAGLSAGALQNLLIIAPVVVIGLATLWRGARLGDHAFLAGQCVVEVLMCLYVLSTEIRGAQASGEIVLIAPVVIAAVFAGRRLHVGLQTALTVAVAAVTIQHRFIDQQAVPQAIVAHTFAFVSVAVVVRLLRDLALAAVRKAELGEITDPLTGLMNRRGFEREGTREWGERAQGHLPLAVLLIDIDHFKRVNDTLGHAAGDEILRRVGGRLTTLLRAGDQAFRLGGEEFAVLARCRPGEAAAIAERVRMTIEKELPVTVSIGVQEALPAHAADLAATLWQSIDAVDVGLYEAKRSGRNRVVSIS